MSACACAVAEPAGATPDVIVRNYCAAEQTDARSLAGSSMDVEIDASLPRLKKHGRLYALRRISSLGRITYERLRFEGDGTVKSQVIARYLTAEAQAQQTQNPALAVTPENYKFKYKGANELDGRTVYVFQVTPRKKQVGLFKGEVWIDSTTYLRLQESGRLVKSPSIFLKKVQFVRTYEIVDGISVPRQMQSVVDTRIVGKAELTIDFSNFALEHPNRDGLALGNGQ
ncbi:MAG TPA: hypothetical protein VG675_15510 [Bryobacteraceae bacterium]|nr:hypothetical protein [Bryobacteraceae bacterium]